MNVIDNKLENQIIFKKVSLIFLLWKGLFFLLNFATINFGLMDERKGSFYFFPKNTWLDSFFRWDVGWYDVLINNGYSFTPGKQSNVAFFPLYPLLVKIISTITNLKTSIAGLLLSNICLLLALFFTYKIAQIYLKEELCERVLILILTFPVSFFFSSLYTESLYFLTISASFYFFLKKQYLWSGIWGFLASLTRLTGIVLVVVFFLDLIIKYWKDKKFEKSVFSLLLIPCGLLSFMYFLYLKFGNPWVFIEVQKTWGRGENTFFVNTLSQGLSNLHFLFHKDPDAAMIFLDSFFSVLALLILIFYSRKCHLNLALVMFCILSIIIPLSTGNNEAMMRFILPLFPIFILLAYISRKTSVYITVICLFTYLQSALFVWFANWGWVT